MLRSSSTSRTHVVTSRRRAGLPPLERFTPTRRCATVLPFGRLRPGRRAGSPERRPPWHDGSRPMAPPWASTMPRAMARPRPAPGAWPSPRARGAGTPAPASRRGMPGPVVADPDGHRAARSRRRRRDPDAGGVGGVAQRRSPAGSRTPAPGGRGRPRPAAGRARATTAPTDAGASGQAPVGGLAAPGAGRTSRGTSRSDPESMALRVEQVADQPAHAGRLRGDASRGTAPATPGPSVTSSWRSVCGVALDGGERRAQLVVEAGEESRCSKCCERRSGAASALGVLQRLPLEGQAQRPGGVVEQVDGVVGEPARGPATTRSARTRSTVRARPADGRPARRCRPAGPGRPAGLARSDAVGGGPLVRPSLGAVSVRSGNSTGARCDDPRPRRWRAMASAPRPRHRASSATAMPPWAGRVRPACRARPCRVSSTRLRRVASARRLLPLDGGGGIAGVEEARAPAGPPGDGPPACRSRRRCRGAGVARRWVRTRRCERRRTRRERRRGPSRARCPPPPRRRRFGGQARRPAVGPQGQRLHRGQHGPARPTAAKRRRRRARRRQEMDAELLHAQGPAQADTISGRRRRGLDLGQLLDQAAEPAQLAAGRRVGLDARHERHDVVGVDLDGDMVSAMILPWRSTAMRSARAKTCSEPVGHEQHGCAAGPRSSSSRALDHAGRR